MNKYIHEKENKILSVGFSIGLPFMFCDNNLLCEATYICLSCIKNSYVCFYVIGRDYLLYVPFLKYSFKIHVVYMNICQWSIADFIT